MRKKNKTTIFRSATTLMMLMTGIKAIAFIKQTILARYFGADPSLDLYLLSADSLGDFSVAAFSALSVAMLTFYVSLKEKTGQEAALGLVKRAFKVFVPIATLISILSFLAAPFLAKILAVNYSESEQGIVAQYIRWLCPTIVFLCVTYMFVAVLDANKVFWPGKFIGFTLSIFVIAATAIYGKDYGTNALVFAYVLAYFVHMIMVSFCVKPYIYGIVRTKSKPSMRPMLIMMLPVVLGNAIVEINALVDKLLATNVGAGSLSTQTYGATLNSFVVSILITAPSSVLVSYLVTCIVEGNTSKAEAYVQKSILLLGALLMPIMAISWVWAKEIVTVIYQRGAFDNYAAVKTAETLRGYAVGFPLVAIREILIKVHFAYKDSKTVMVNSTISILCNIGISIILCRLLGLMGISLGTSVAAGVAAALCIHTVKKHMPTIFDTKMLIEVGKIVMATIVVWGIAKGFYYVKPLETGIAEFTLTALFCLLLYILLLIILKSEVYILVKKSVKHAFPSK